MRQPVLNVRPTAGAGTRGSTGHETLDAIDNVPYVSSRIILPRPSSGPWPRIRASQFPIPPRCKLCHTPFGRPGNVLRFVGFGPSRLNRRICSGCIHALEKRPGGAEVELSFLFADVRDSTAFAESISAEEFPSSWRGSGVAFVGAVGEGDARDFTALGDAVNTAL